LYKYTENQNLVKLRKVINKIHEGVHSDVLMPWGTPANKESIHVMDMKKKFPIVLSRYDD